MSYRKKPQVFTLTWDADSAYPGLTVRVRSVPVGEVTDLAGALYKVTSQGIAAASGAMGTAMAMLAGHLVSWDLEEEDGTPVPVTLDAVRAQDLDLILAVLAEWMGAIAGVAPPLPQGSNGGGTFPELSLPMEPLSPSLSS